MGQQPGQAGHVGGWDMDMGGGGRGVHMEVPPGDSPGQEEPNPRVGEMMFGAGKEAQKEMEEFLAPKEVNTGMDVLPEVGFSAGGVSLGSLDGLAAWKEK